MKTYNITTRLIYILTSLLLTCMFLLITIPLSYKLLHLNSTSSYKSERYIIEAPPYSTGNIILENIHINNLNDFIPHLVGYISNVGSSDKRLVTVEFKVQDKSKGYHQTIIAGAFDIPSKRKQYFCEPIFLKRDNIGDIEVVGISYFEKEVAD